MSCTTEVNVFQGTRHGAPFAPLGECLGGGIGWGFIAAFLTWWPIYPAVKAVGVGDKWTSSGYTWGYHVWVFVILIYIVIGVVCSLCHRLSRVYPRLEEAYRSISTSNTPLSKVDVKEDGSFRLELSRRLRASWLAQIMLLSAIWGAFVGGLVTLLAWYVTVPIGWSQAGGIVSWLITWCGSVSWALMVDFRAAAATRK